MVHGILLHAKSPRFRIKLSLSLSLSLLNGDRILCTMINILNHLNYKL
ncbi:MAG: hypothetical protein J8272_01010 ['Prunus persica' phytoplasma PP2]|nr:hypothetical protein ['Prunus persica' phytoplasma PP2]